MQRKGSSIEQVYDVRALRIIVKSKENCYAALREVEKLWTPIEGRHKVCSLEFDFFLALNSRCEDCGLCLRSLQGRGPQGKG